MIPKLLRAALLCLTLTSLASAGELVILVQPKDASPRLREAFNRLRGELSLHGFNVQVVTAEETLTSKALGERADREKAVASVSFATKEDGDGIGRVEVWISDRVTGKTTTQTIVPRSPREAPTVLSVRALELLRASLRDVAPEEEEEQVEVEGAHPERAQQAVKEIRVPPPPVRSFTFDVGAAASWSLPDGQDAYGPEMTAGYVHGAFGTRIFALGPFQGGRARVGTASVRYQTFSMGLEPLFFPVRSPRWTLGFFPLAAITHLDVSGEIGAPFVGASDDGWLFTAGGGAEAGIHLTRSLEIYLRGRGFWLLPRPVVLLGTHEVELSSPSFSLGLGVRLSPG